MQPQQSAQQLLRQITALDEAIGKSISQNIPSKILLHLFMVKGLVNGVKSDELNKMIDAPASTFDRYVELLASEGMIEFLQADLSQPAEIRISDTAKMHLAAVFLSPA
ncbi:hypothetical protein [Parasphingorhabdus halotolerans]|uniref:Uncharacterized protein n=1 Tax=Parasphingorhabdus halotolerans TaxID=2725558 RepID=A0A6H2DJB4_9SPHN|nr:hypothetical protein [Parasphingorhabdus halotolerans]QJB68035.1 hypothetical protein HF685_00860 [Parasphingorhabdus halotolerans]